MGIVGVDVGGLSLFRGCCIYIFLELSSFPFMRSRKFMMRLATTITHKVLLNKTFINF